jgi:hypothetical protein
VTLVAGIKPAVLLREIMAAEAQAARLPLEGTLQGVVLISFV